MAAYRLSELARADLLAIADYTLDTWGEEQAHRHLDDLEKCLGRVAQSPGLGRSCDRVRRGYRRLEYAKHVIFYRMDSEGVFISRILHERMLPRPDLLDDSESDPPSSAPR